MATDSSYPNSNLGEWITHLREPSTATVASTDESAIDAEAKDNAVSWAAEHARRYVASDGADDGWDGPRPIVVLYTTGRRSGETRRNPVLCFEHDGERYVIASLGGAPKHPLWYLNLVAQPRVRVRFQSEFYDAEARTVPAEERARLWPELVARYPMFGDYEQLTDRQIPMVHLRATSACG